MTLPTDDPAILVAVAIVSLVAFLYLYDAMYKPGNDRSTIPYLGPSFSPQSLVKSMSSTVDTGWFYEEIKKRGHKLARVFNVLWRTVLVIHPDYIADVSSEYLNGHFVERGFYYSKKEDGVPANLTALDGRNCADMLTKLNPTFDSDEMKYMFDAALEVSENLIEAIERSVADEVDVDVREFLACFTADFIKYSVYQQKSNSFKHLEEEFQKKRWGFLQKSLNTIFRSIHSVQELLGLRAAEDDATYYYHAVREDMRRREANEECLLRARLYEMIFEIEEQVINTQYPGVLFKTAGRSADFFSGSFDTSSTTLYFAIYELCRNPDVQERARNEIEEVLSRHEGNLTCGSLGEMTYLQQIIDETLRMYPPVPNRVRICIKDYTLTGTELTIPEGTRLVIPIFSLHRDEQYFPHPETFDPERFADVHRHSHQLFMPFGEGSVKCRGIHLTLLQVKIGLIKILRKFVLKISPTTKMPLKLDPQMFLRSADVLYITAKKYTRNL